MTQARPSLISIGDIVEMLKADIERLARDLLPMGHREGDEWREASKRNGGLGDSCCIHLRGARRGLFLFGAASAKGDPLDAIACLRTGDDKKQAVLWAKSWLGIDKIDRAQLETVRADAAKRNAEARTQDEADAEQRRRGAHAIYLSAQAIENTPVQRYLLGRGVDIRRFRYPINAVRFHPELWNTVSRSKWPAMVAPICDAKGKFLAVHRTWLQVLPNGDVVKAPIVNESGKEESKRTLGNYRGGVIRLWRGTRIDPKTGEIKQARRLADEKNGVIVDITEGIEDGLSVALDDEEARVLCGVALPNMARIILPDCVECVVLWRDNDAPGSPAEAGFERVRAHFQAQGKKVAVAVPPPGFKDANDVLRANGVRTPEEEQKHD